MTFYRLRVSDPLDTHKGRDAEGLFTADEVETIRQRWYDVDGITDVLVATPVCNDCYNCQHGRICNR